MEAFSKLTSRVIALPTENIDTDQICPARFLVTTAREDLGEALFADWRFTAAGALRPDCAFNHPELAGARILLAGRNFGCGSSREHAAWALVDFGIRVVISTELADIFRGNALRNGLLAIEIDADAHRSLLRQMTEMPSREAAVDLEAQTIALPDGSRVSFEIDAFAKHCLANGVDQLGYLLEQAPFIAGYEARNPARVDTFRTLGKA